MTQWSQEFTNHPVHATLKDFESALNDMEASNGLDAETIESIDRLRQIHRLVVSTLNLVDPNLVAPSRLGTLNGVLSEQLLQINNFRSSRNIVDLANAHNSIDNLFAQLALLPTFRSSEDLDGVRDAIASFRISFGQHARNLESDQEKVGTQFEDINRRFSEFTSEITSQKSRLDTAISQFQQQFSDAESKRREEYSTEATNTRTELNKVVQTGKEEIGALTSTLRKEFDTAEEERKSEYGARFSQTKTSLEALLDKGKSDLFDLTKRNTDTFNTFITEARESRKELEEEFSLNVDQYFKHLELRKSEAEKLVQVIGNTGMVGGYQKLANDERRAAWMWHAVTFVFMVGLVLFAIIAFHSTIQGDFKLGTFGARAFVAIAFGLGVAWSARQADKHQDVERRSRKMELELASINPYLALLPDDTQFAVKTELAKRFFGQIEPVDMSKAETQVTGSAFDIVRMALEMIAKNK